MTASHATLAPVDDSPAKRYSEYAERRYGSCLWYAWGRTDSGQYGAGVDVMHGFKFAEQQRDAAEEFHREAEHSLPSIMDAWDAYADEEGLTKVLDYRVAKKAAEDLLEIHQATGIDLATEDAKDLRDFVTEVLRLEDGLLT